MERERRENDMGRYSDIQSLIRHYFYTVAGSELSPCSSVWPLTNNGGASR